MASLLPVVSFTITLTVVREVARVMTATTRVDLDGTIVREVARTFTVGNT
jgi:hypothetical protein